MAVRPGKFIWFEHVSDDPAQAKAFYAALLGWSVKEVPMGEQPYPMLHNGETPIGGLRGDAGGSASHWACWMSVEDVAAKVGAAEGAGGKMLMPPTDFPGFGRGAMLQDPQGAMFGIWRSTSGDDVPDPDRPPVGSWCWCELMTDDAAAALVFYEQAFGYEHDEMPMPQGSYFVLKTGGVSRGGLMANPQPGVAPNWMPYVEVADADATAAKARSLGGSVLLEPSDIPQVGRIAVLTDAQGAPFGVIRGAAR